MTRDDVRGMIEKSHAQGHSRGYRAPLNRAAGSGDIETVRLFVECGMDLDLAGNAALQAAVQGGQREVEEYLLQSGVEPDMQSEHVLRTTQMKQYRASNKCFVATACYGSCDHPDVLVFRRFRDERLLPLGLGRAAVSAYYAVSPTLAGRIERVPWLAAGIRLLLLEPLARSLR